LDINGHWGRTSTGQMPSCQANNSIKALWSTEHHIQQINIEINANYEQSCYKIISADIATCTLYNIHSEIHPLLQFGKYTIFTSTYILQNKIQRNLVAKKVKK